VNVFTLTTMSMLSVANRPLRRCAALLRRRTLRCAAALGALCALLLSVPASAQQLSLRRYGKADGLVNQNPACLLQDHADFLWVCTENGLFRYDGSRFRRFGEDDGLDNTLVHSAIEDRSGRIWVATSSDLYLGEQGRFRPVRPQGRALPFAKEVRLRVLADGRIAAIVQRQLIALREDGRGGWLAEPMLSAAQVADTPDLARLLSAYQAPGAGLWLGCGAAICSVDARGVRRWGTSDGVPEDEWVAFLRDAGGALWARGRRGVLLLPAAGERFVPQAVPNAALRTFSDASVLAESSDGSIVLRTDKGVARWRLGRWSEWTMGNGLPSPDITALLFDREGSLWMGIGGLGLARWLGYGRFESWTHSQGLDSDVIWGLIRRPGGPVNIGTRNGCSQLESGSTLALPCGIDGLPLGEVSSLALAADGRLWIGMNAGELLVVEPGTRMSHLVARLPRFTSLLVDSRQRLWVPSRGGVFLLAPGEAVPRLVSEEHEFLDAAEDAQGGIWLAGSDGLLRYADGGWWRAPLADRRAGPGFSSIAIGKDGTLWAASRSRGLMRATIDVSGLRDPHWVSDPLVADASPMFVRLDAMQRVWVGTDYGVLAGDGSGAAARWFRLTESDGLIWNDVNGGSFLADADGSIWVGTSGGLSHIVDPARALSRPPLKLRVIDARYAERPLAIAGTPRLAWSQSAALDLDLVSLDFSRSIDSVFRYRIVGVDADWFDSRSARVHYPAMAPGSYRFEAMLVDPDRRQSSAVVGFAFEVLPPWWQTLWFRALTGLIAGLLLVVAWRWQVARLNARHLSAQQQAREHHLLLERASRDSLTGLWNRAAILDLLAQAIARRPAGEPLALAVLDVDHFKHVNDTHGHAAGDAVLRGLARRVTDGLRQVDLLGRYGGEELLLVLPGLPCADPPAAIDRLRAAVAGEPFDLGGGGPPLTVTISVGVAWFGIGRGGEPASHDDALRLFERADAALYDAKRGGRNRVVCALPGAAGAGPSTQELETL